MMNIGEVFAYFATTINEEDDFTPVGAGLFFDPMPTYATTYSS
jgi:hypothetical protein